MMFQLDAVPASGAEVLRLYRACFGEGAQPDEFAVTLFHAAAGRLDELDEVIRGCSEHWRLERMSRVDRSILRIGVHELTSPGEIPPKVAINEAVELAKRFGSADSPSFVNGILDRVARDRGLL